MYLVGFEVEHGQEGVRVCFVAVDFYGAAEQWLREDDVGELGEIEELAVYVEELAQQGF